MFLLKPWGWGGEDAVWAGQSVSAAPPCHPLPSWLGPEAQAHLFSASSLSSVGGLMGDSGLPGQEGRLGNLASLSLSLHLVFSPSSSSGN